MANATFLFAGTDEGLLVATRPGTSPDWHVTRMTLADQTVVALALGTTFPIRLVAATAGGTLFHSADGGREWTPVRADAGPVLLADPADAEQIYGVPAPPLGSSPVLMSADGGLTWQVGGPWPGAPEPVHSLALTGSAAGARRLWAGLAAGGVIASPDGGAPWEPSRPGLETAGPVTALGALGPAPTDLVAGSARRAVSPRGGGAGRRRAGLAPRGAGAAWRDGPAAPGAARPGHRCRAGAACARRHGDGADGRRDGRAWIPCVLPGSPAAATAIAAHPEYPDRAYAATAGGRIYETRNRGDTWTDTGLAVESAIRALAVAVLK